MYLLTENEGLNQSQRIKKKTKKLKIQLSTSNISEEDVKIKFFKMHELTYQEAEQKDRELWDPPRSWHFPLGGPELIEEKEEIKDIKQKEKHTELE